MVRAFAAATGFSVMPHVRVRRLSEAARALSADAPDSLDVALDADCGSHEAFTRAFRDHFSVTPELVRATTWRDQLELQEPILVDSTARDSLAPPRFETGRAMLIAGPGDRFGHDNGANIPGLWQRFHQHLQEPPRPNRSGSLRRLLQWRRRRQFRRYRRRRSA